MEKEAVPLVIIGEQNEVIFKTENLETLLCREEIKDHLIVVLSIAGSPRKGKSFMMKFAGIYLRSLRQSNADTDWLDIEELPSVFESRRGTNKVTNGIEMWPEVFLTTLPNGEKVAIILLDTQGSFDRESTVKESVTVFALTTMISSVQIYNLSKNIEGRDLQQLELFTEYGRLASRKHDRKESKPFQKLQFLIRDWTSLDEAPYGATGGQIFLNKIFEETRNIHEENKLLRENIKSSFDEMNCFLMPPPSDRVISGSEFTGKVENFVGSIFYRYLMEFIPSLLAPENLLPKEMHGVRITVNEFVSHFKNYVKIFTSDKLPEPKTILMAIVEASNEKFSKSALDIYNNMMMRYCKRGTLISIDDLKSEHEKCQADALIHFDRANCHMGGDELYLASYKKLKEDIQSSLKNYGDIIRQTNQSIAKNECENAFRDALLHYYASMTEFCNANTVSFDELDKEHRDNSLKAIEIFNNYIEKFNDSALYDIGEVNFYQPCIEKLKQVIDTMRKRFCDNVNRVHKAFIAVNNNEAFIRSILYFQNATKNCYSSEKMSEMISKLKEKKIEALRIFDEMRNEENEELWEPLWKKLEEEIDDMMTSFINQKKELDKALSSTSVSTFMGRIGVGLVGAAVPLFPVNPAVAVGTCTIGVISLGCSEIAKVPKASKKKTRKEEN